MRHSLNNHSRTIILNNHSRTIMIVSYWLIVNKTHDFPSVMTWLTMERQFISVSKRRLGSIVPCAPVSFEQKINLFWMLSLLRFLTSAMQPQLSVMFPTWSRERAPKCFHFSNDVQEECFHQSSEMTVACIRNFSVKNCSIPRKKNVFGFLFYYLTLVR